MVTQPKKTTNLDAEEDDQPGCRRRRSNLVAEEDEVALDAEETIISRERCWEQFLEVDRYKLSKCSSCKK